MRSREEMRPEFFDRQPWAPRVNHTVAVRANERQVSQSGRGTVAQVRNGFDLVALNETLPSFSILLCKIEVANFADYSKPHTS